MLRDRLFDLVVLKRQNSRRQQSGILCSRRSYRYGCYRTYYTYRHCYPTYYCYRPVYTYPVVSYVSYWGCY